MNAITEVIKALLTPAEVYARIAEEHGILESGVAGDGYASWKFESGVIVTMAHENWKTVITIIEPEDGVKYNPAIADYEALRVRREHLQSDDYLYERDYPEYMSYGLEARVLQC
jgi:hypothetical protein